MEPATHGPLVGTHRNGATFKAYERSIVQVNLVRSTDKKVESKLWFLALIPYVTD